MGDIENAVCAYRGRIPVGVNFKDTQVKLKIQSKSFGMWRTQAKLTVDLNDLMSSAKHILEFKDLRNGVTEATVVVEVQGVVVGEGGG